MRLCMVALLCTAGILFFYGSAAAATYYVATTGNNSNDGSSGSPWLTLQHAETTATDGDTIHVAAGTYTENDATYGGWATSKAISWIADGAVTVRSTGTVRVAQVRGATSATSFNGFTFDAQGTDSYAVFIDGVANKTFTNCTFSGATSMAVNVNGTSITINTSTFTVTAGRAFRATNFNGISMDGNTFSISGTATKLFDTTGTGGTLSMTNSTITSTMAAGSAIFHPSVAGTYTITGNTITNTGRVFFASAATITATFSNNVMSSSRVGSEAMIEISISGTYTISGNTGTNAGKILLATVGTGTISYTNNNLTNTLVASANYVDFSTGTWTITATGNTFTSATATGTGNVFNVANQASPNISSNTIDTASTDALSHITISSTGTAGGTLQVTNNTMRSRSTSGYVISIGSEGSTAGDGMLDGGTVEGNTIYGAIYYDPTALTASTHSIFYSYNKNANIRYNTVIGGGYGVVIKGGGLTWTAGGVYYNKFINCIGVSPVRIKGVKDLNVHNNTIYADPALSDAYNAFNITENGASETSTGTVLKNNLVSHAGTATIISIDAGSLTGLVSNYNLFYDSTGGDLASTPTNYTFAAWQALGYDANSVTSAPSFTDAAAYDFTLAVGSPAINAGTALGYTRDFAGNTVPVGVTDIGAYEVLPAPPTRRRRYRWRTATAPPRRTGRTARRHRRTPLPRATAQKRSPSGLRTASAIRRAT
ncbi:hypothetical protein HYS28_02965 [Candidatus Uhrbacteria bacterium]|nr:hypothetical protein [Candidatus Uhrbacteria bacterium]